MAEICVDMTINTCINCNTWHNGFSAYRIKESVPRLKQLIFIFNFNVPACRSLTQKIGAWDNTPFPAIRETQKTAGCNGLLLEKEKSGIKKKIGPCAQLALLGMGSLICW
jgi:hypothetical protein